MLPGQLVRFKIKLDVDPAYAATYAASFGDSLPDFRTVLFDMNGNNVYDGVVNTSSADNAQASVVFNPGGKSQVVAFADETVPAGQYFNNNLREYKAMDPVLIFQVGGGEIPEPTQRRSGAVRPHGGNVVARPITTYASGGLTRDTIDASFR